VGVEDSRFRREDGSVDFVAINTALDDFEANASAEQLEAYRRTSRRAVLEHLATIRKLAADAGDPGLSVVVVRRPTAQRRGRGPSRRPRSQRGRRVARARSPGRLDDPHEPGDIARRAAA
jgi:hypothetical protein